MLPKLAIITTHPIQYNAPWFKLLSERGVLDLKVFYTWEQSKEKVYDPLFNREIKWDIPLLSGYEYSFLQNIAKEPGAHHFFGLDNPTIISDIKKYRPDAILVFGWNYKSHLKVLRYFKGNIPILFRGDSTLLNDKPGIKSTIRRLFLKWVYSHVDVAMYVGEKNKSYYINAGLKDKQLQFSPHAIDNNRFNIAANLDINKSWREKLKIPISDKVFLFAGKLEPRKNPHLLIDAFLEINAPSTHLVIVGNGVMEEELKKKCALVPNIHFVDFQNQQMMPSIYHFSDVYVLPSLSETWGLAVNEAMACSKAILLSNKCGCAVDLVKHGLNGFIFENGDKEDLKHKLNFFLSKSNSEIRTMGLRSFDIIKEWSFENICKSLEIVVKKYA